MKISVIHGPNLNRLGKRAEKHYGNLALKELDSLIKEKAAEMHIQLEIMQSNHEGEIIDYIQEVSEKMDGMIINPGAFTHYSYAIRDALEDCLIPTIEVHLSNIYSREDFRAKSVTAPSCNAQIAGLGYQGYLVALEGLDFLIKEQKKSKQNKEV